MAALRTGYAATVINEHRGLQIRGRWVLFSASQTFCGTHSVSFLSGETGQAVEASVALKQHDNKFNRSIFALIFTKISSALGTLPWLLPLLAFPELHRLHYDPGRHRDIMSGLHGNHIRKIFNFLGRFYGINTGNAALVFITSLQLNKHDL